MEGFEISRLETDTISAVKTRGTGRIKMENKRIVFEINQILAAIQVRAEIIHYLRNENERDKKNLKELEAEGIGGE